MCDNPYSAPLRSRLVAGAFYHPNGFTLIEVIAGLAILGSLLAATVLARVAYTRQWVKANQKLEAVAAADALLAQWWRAPEGLPVSGAGDVPGWEKLTWRTHELPDDAAASIGGRVVRLEILPLGGHQTAETESPWATVDVVLPTAASENERETQADAQSDDNS